MCKKEFRSSVKVFNPLEIKILQNEVWKCLIYKNTALPKQPAAIQLQQQLQRLSLNHSLRITSTLAVAYKAIITFNLS